MDDIVKRLRAWSGTPFDDEAKEAAAEIEELRLRVEEFTFLIKAIKGYV